MGKPPTVGAKAELIQIDLELIAAQAVIGADQPLLQVAYRPVCGASLPGTLCAKAGYFVELTGRAIGRVPIAI